MKLTRPIPFVFVIVSMFSATPTDAAVVTLTPLKDNTLYEDPEGDASNGQGGSIYVGKTSTGGGLTLRRGLIAFDVASIPAGSIISNVVLKMWHAQSGPDEDPVTVSLHASKMNWGEGASSGGGVGGEAMPGDATWLHNFYPSTNWTTIGGDFRGAPSASTVVDDLVDSAIPESRLWSSATLVADVQAWVNQPTSNFGWFILGNESKAGTAQRFISSEGGLALSPELTITYTIPEPSSALLVLAGASMLVRRRRLDSVS